MFSVSQRDALPLKDNLKPPLHADTVNNSFVSNSIEKGRASLKIGLNISPAPTEDLLAAGRLAEELGFDALFIGEHIAVPVTLSVPYPGKVGYHSHAYQHEPYVALAALAAATKVVRLGTGISILPIREPLQTARAITTLDRLSNGRLDVAIGSGSIVDEFAVMASDYATRNARLEEMVEIFDCLFTQDKPSYQGRHYRFPEIGFEPKPVQRPRPPIYLGAFGPVALKRAARIADGWYGAVYNPEHAKGIIGTINGHLKEYGRDPAQFKYALIHAAGEPILPTAQECKAYEDIGVEMIVISPFDLVAKDILAKIREVAEFLKLAPRQN